jgi:hypothetical protein
MKKIILILLLFLPSIVSAKITNDPFVKQWAYSHISLYEAWDITSGSNNIVVAVLDNGFDTFHPDLRKNVWKNVDEIPNNKIDDDKNGYVDDVYGWNFLDDNNNPRPNVENLTAKEKREGVFNHGTLVAGIIGAVGDNELDGVGVSPKVSLMNLKVLGNNGNGSFSGFPKAVRYAVDNGADVISISMVGDLDTTNIVEAVEYAYANDVVIVAAAGNDGHDLNKNPLYPVCLGAEKNREMIFGVSAINENRRLAAFSNFGSNCVDITAPGQGLNSLLRFSPSNDLKERYGKNWNGTSFATPLVSGAVALIKSIQPNWGPKEIFDAITSTVFHTPGQDEEVYANLFGAGLLQVDRALKYALDRMESNKIISKIVNIDYFSGQIGFRDVKEGVHQEKFIGSLEGINNIISFKHDGEVRFVTTKYFNKKTKIEIFDSEWKTLDTWQVASSGEMDLAVGNVRGDKNLEIVLSPKYDDDIIYTVYSLEGAFIDEYSINDIHKGVSLTILDNQIVVVYNLQLEIFENNKVVREFLIGLDSVGDIEVGDIDHDGQQEYVLTTQAGDVPYLVYYEQDGKLKRKFSAYDTGYRGGMDLVVGDYDGDGQDDILVAPLEGGQPVRVWSGKVRKLDEWYPFVSPTKGIKLLVY